MRAVTVTAMILAAAAASAATIVALKKAYDKRRLDDELEDWDYPVCEDSDENDDEDKSPQTTDDACCKDGVCSLNLDDADEETDSIDEPVSLDLSDEDSELNETENA